MDSPRIVLFSNDPSGLGHLRRTLKIAWYLHGRWPGSRQLIVTGSPGIQILPIPDGAELLKLPSITSSGFRKHTSRYLPMSFPEIRELRRDLLLDLGRHYQPDLALIDHLPAGPGGDLVPCLREMKARSPRTRLVLGLRDVTYEPGLLRKAWDAEGVYDLLDGVYDLILVYGQRQVFDAVESYGFPPAVAGKTRHVGYLGGRPAPAAPDAGRTGLGPGDGRLVVVTVGGGDVGLGLLHTMVEALELSPEGRPFDCVLVCGPLTSSDGFEGLRQRVSRRPGLRVLPYVADLSDCMAAADLVVSTAGYNSVCEILSLGRPAILVPTAQDIGEQRLRAQLMARRGLFRTIEPSDLNPARLLSDVLDALDRPPTARPPVDLNGLAAMATELEALLDGVQAPA
jgi:predicted glycosyltransferase